MADEQDASNEGDSVPEYEQEEERETTTQPPAISDDAPGTTAASVDDYADEDEVLPDVTINLYINDGPGDVIGADGVTAGLTDIYGSSTTQSSLIEYSTTLTDSLYTDMITNGTEIGGKGWFGVWTWNKILFVGLIALCIIGIILALLFLIIGKKFKKNKRPKGSGSTTTTKSVVSTNVAAGGRYEPVRNV